MSVQSCTVPSGPMSALSTPNDVIVEGHSGRAGLVAS